ncbi:MAG: RHS repeat-associated core domain-containing protein [Chloroflexi bacterium]|nr:RHS repeat-associated core domain-containing protein [Chloroflexota bacterium]
MAGLVFLRARFYNPNVGRFLTKDPFHAFPSLPSMLHPYTYALNNPVNLVDPSGHNPLLVAMGLGGLIGRDRRRDPPLASHALANP